MAETAGPAAAAVAVTVAATQPEHVTANVVASGPAPSAEKTPEVASSTPKEPTAAAPPKPAAAAPASNPEPAKTAKADAPPNPSTTFHGKGDDFYNTIFYFSGMGSVIGSALAHGVYVSEQNRRNAVDADDVGSRGGGRQTEQLVVGARGQAQNLSTDFHKLQGLLESLPVFTGAGGSSAAAAALDRRNELDQPIHGELYFRCKERFPVQPSPTPASQLQARRDGGHDRPRSRASEAADERSRRRYDDSVLDEVTRAAVEAFPLLPPAARGLVSSPASSGRASRDRDAAAASPAVPRRRPAPPPGQFDWSSETTSVDVRPWQMSHVRQYDVIDGYPVQRP